MAGAGLDKQIFYSISINEKKAHVSITLIEYFIPKEDLKSGIAYEYGMEVEIELKDTRQPIIMKSKFDFTDKLSAVRLITKLINLLAEGRINEVLKEETTLTLDREKLLALI